MEMKKQDSPRSITVLAVGDVMLARRVQEQIDEHGPAFPFHHVRPLLSQGDISFGNLESPLSRHGTPRHTRGSPVFRGPPEAARGLREAGFQAMSVANNHIFDYGEAAFRETLDVLKAVGIYPVGAGLNLEAALAPVVLPVRGNRIAFLAFCNARVATRDSPGTAPLRRDVVRAAISDARAQADWVVVSFHQGLEYSDYPTSGTITTAHQMIDAGADAVVGHHPHVLQGIERYSHGVIAYSLGNFVFDQHEPELKLRALARSAMTQIGGQALDPTDQRMAESVILQVSLRVGQPPDYSPNPVYINDRYQPVLMEESEADELRRRLDTLSSTLSELDSREIQLMDAIALKARVRKLWHSPTALLRLRPRHLRAIWRSIVRSALGGR